MVSFKIQCIDLRKKGFSLNQIVTKTGRPKTSVYFHIRNLELNRERKVEIKLAAIKRLNTYTQSIKGKSRLNRHPIPFYNWTTETVSLVAHLLFDGEINYSSCVYTNRNLCLIDQVRESMKVVYPFPPRQFESFPEIWKIGYYNVELCSYLKIKSEKLLNNILRLPRILQRTFLKAFFDDEGSVYFIGNRRNVRGYQHNYKLLLMIQKLLKNFCIGSVVDKKYNEITISRRENLINYAKEINFLSGLKVNGKRKNSVWKKDLEKRAILQNALNSYKTK